MNPAFFEWTLNLKASFTFNNLAGTHLAEPDCEAEFIRYFFCHTLVLALKRQPLPYAYAVKNAQLWFAQNLKRECKTEEVEGWFFQYLFPHTEYFPQFGYGTEGELTLMPWHRAKAYFPRFKFEDPTDYMVQAYNFWTWKIQHGAGLRKWVEKNIEALEPVKEIQDLIRDLLVEYNQDFKRYSFVTFDPEEAKRRNHPRLLIPWSELFVGPEGILPGNVLKSTVCEEPCLIQLSKLPEGEWLILSNVDCHETYAFNNMRLYCNGQPIPLGRIGGLLTQLAHHQIQMEGNDIDFGNNLFVTPLQGADAMVQDVSYWYREGRFASQIRT